MKKRLLFLCLSLISIKPYAQFVQTSHPDTAFISYFRMTEAGSMTAGDGGMSVRLPDGRTAWLISDSYISAVNPVDTSLACLFDINNCLLLQDSINESEIITRYRTFATGVQRTFFTTDYSPGGNDRFWPVHGFTNTNKLYVFLHRIQGGLMEFAGSYLAQLSLPSLTIDSITEISKSDILWGHYVLPNAAGDTLYIYGTRKNWITFDNYLARCPIDEIYGQWQYFTGSDWSMDSAMAGKITLVTAKVFGNGMSVLPLQGKYYLFLQENGFLSCGLGRNIEVFRSDNPWGPFDLEKSVYTIKDSYADTFMITYQAFAHAEFTRNDEVLISYAVNNVCPNQCQNIWTDRINADTYRLKFIRVPFNVIDPDLQLNLDIADPEITLPEVLVFPNPVTNWLTIKPGNSETKILEVYIINNAGIVSYVSDYKTNMEMTGNFKINMQSFSCGLYIVKILTNESVVCKKVIKR